MGLWNAQVRHQAMQAQPSVSQGPSSPRISERMMAGDPSYQRLARKIISAETMGPTPYTKAHRMWARRMIKHGIELGGGENFW